MLYGKYMLVSKYIVVILILVSNQYSKQFPLKVFAHLHHCTTVLILLIVHSDPTSSQFSSPCKKNSKRDSASVWKPCNRNDFTCCEIITKLKVYMVLQYTHQIAHVTCAQPGRLQKYTVGWSSENTRICILTKCFKQRKLLVDLSENV